jgi:hypothetical protein
LPAAEHDADGVGAERLDVGQRLGRAVLIPGVGVVHPAHHEGVAVGVQDAAAADGEAGGRLGGLGRHGDQAGHRDGQGGQAAQESVSHVVPPSTSEALPRSIDGHLPTYSVQCCQHEGNLGVPGASFVSST